MKNKRVIGILLVALGALCYGVLATIAKLAYKQGYYTAEINMAQSSIAVAILGLMSFITTYRRKNLPAANPHSRRHLMLLGTSAGATGIFYYSALNYLSVAFGAVLLMQSVWMGVVVESFKKKRWPTPRKIIAIVLVLMGTIYATDLIQSGHEFNGLGILLGLLSAVSYTITIYTTESVGIDLPIVSRSFWMMAGAIIPVGIYFLFHLKNFNPSIFYSFHGWSLALFGPVLATIFLTKGMPNAGIGLGAIVSSLELPSAIIIAHFVLNESVKLSQWLGIFIILIAILLIRYEKS